VKYPTLTPRRTTTEFIDVFGGYNHNPRIGDSESYDMVNMTSDNYPLLSPRTRRGLFKYFDGNPHNVSGMISKVGLCWVEANNNNLSFYMNGEKYDLGQTNVSDTEERTLISMGAYVIIRPDNKYFNTENENDKGDIEASLGPLSASFELTDIEGEGYTKIEKGDTAPKAPEDLMYWVDKSTTPPTLKQYSKSAGMWIAVATTYIRINAPNIARDFKEGDGVRIDGVSQLPDLNGKVSVIQKAYHEETGIKDYIVVIGITENELTANEVTFSRTMPIMDFVIESNNRLWGCRYGLAANGKIVNEIYASKLGDFKNWNVFQGVSTDSYVVSLGSDGMFTGAASYLGNPVFFKENYIHQIYGYYPAQYQVQTTQGRGVQKGSHKSIAVVNETMFYKANNAICAYRGSLPSEISEVFGGVYYKDAVGAAHNNKYYVSMTDTYNSKHLFVYDTIKGLWHKEDDADVLEFCSSGGELYIRTPSDKGLITEFGSGEKEKNLSWMAESGKMGLGVHNKKQLARISLRMALNHGSRVRVFVEYDSSGAWDQVYISNGTPLDSFSVAIRPRKCDHFRIRIEGTGEAKIYSIQKSYEIRSDVK
jgi:hypothetical protein